MTLNDLAIAMEEYADEMSDRRSAKQIYRWAADLRVISGEAVLALAHEDRPPRGCTRCGDVTHHQDYCGT